MILEVGNISTRVVLSPAERAAGFEKELENHLRVRADGYQHSPRYRAHQWDGYRHFYRRGQFATGFLPMIPALLEYHGIDYEIKDLRGNMPVFAGHPDRFGELSLDDHQRRFIKKLFESRVGDLPFQRGIWNAATNSGKTAGFGALCQALDRSRCRAILIVHNKLIHAQHVRDFRAALGHDQVGEITDRTYQIRPIVIAMAKSLFNRLESDLSVRRDMAGSFHLLGVDEAHRACGKEYSVLLQHIDAGMRLLLSGTALSMPSVEKKMVITGLSGAVLDKVSKAELMDKGWSRRPTVHLHANHCHGLRALNYAEAYEGGIVLSEERASAIARIILERPGRRVLVNFEKRAHRDMLSSTLEAAGIRHQTLDGKDRDSVRTERLGRFASGEEPVLLASRILQEGINVRGIECLIYAKGGQSPIEISQWSGRAERKGDTEVEIHDFYDNHRWLDKHSRARIKFYKSEGFPLNYHYAKGKTDRPLPS